MFIAVAIVAGVLIGLLRGGPCGQPGRGCLPRLAPARDRHRRAGAAAFTGDAGIGVTLILVSYVLLLAFCVLNLRHAGMGVVFVGIALNLVVMGLNGGMPVRREAIVASGITTRIDDVDSLDFGTKRHLETDDDRLPVLGDIIPVPVAGEVLSFGDLAMSVGVAAVLVNLLRRRTRTMAPDLADQRQS